MMQDFRLQLRAVLAKGDVIQFQLLFEFISERIGFSVGEGIQVLQDAVLHFLSSLVRESYRQNMPEVVSLVFQRQLQVFLGQCAGFAGAGRRTVEGEGLQGVKNYEYSITNYDLRLWYEWGK